jgi:hypothetical protein
MRGPHILADNALVHEEILKLFSEIAGGRYPFALPEIGGRDSSRAEL